VTGYEWDVVESNSLSRIISDPCLRGAVHKLLRRSINWPVWCCIVREVWCWNSITTPFSFARSRNFICRCGW
jgi:hypothetical protein